MEKWTLGAESRPFSCPNIGVSAIYEPRYFPSKNRNHIFELAAIIVHAVLYLTMAPESTALNTRDPTKSPYQLDKAQVSNRRNISQLQI